MGTFEVSQKQKQESETYISLRHPSYTTFHHFQNDVHFWHDPISSQHLTFQKLRNLQIFKGQASLALAVRSFAQPALGREVLDTPGPPRTVRHLPEAQKTKTRRCQTLCYMRNNLRESWWLTISNKKINNHDVEKVRHVQTSPPETTADLHRIARLAWHNSLPKRGPKMMRVSLGQCLATDRRTMIHAITVELVCVATWLHGAWSVHVHW